jgi:hypothetical protein
VEDIIVFYKTNVEHFKLVHRLFQRENEHSFAINIMVFAQPNTQFGLYIVSANGFRQKPNFMKTTHEFPKPKNITDVRSFHGLCQQVGHFSTKIAESLKPLSPLLKKKTGLIWEWTTIHEEAFLKAGQTLRNIGFLKIL